MGFDWARPTIVQASNPRPITNDPQFQDRFPIYGVDKHGAEMLPLPIKFLGEELPEPTHAPTVGEQSEEVLRSVLEYDSARIAKLRDSGALG